MKILKKINREKDKTIIQVTHSHEAADYGDRKINMRDGLCIIPAKSLLIAHLLTHCAHPAIAKIIISCLNTKKCGDKTLLPVYSIITMLVNRELCGNIGIVLEECIYTGVKSDKAFDLILRCDVLGGDNDERS